MTFEIEINSTKIIVKLENRKNMKHCYLRILDKQLIQIRANNYFTIKDAKNLLEKKLKWIEESLLKLEEKSLNENEFFYLGEVKNLMEYKVKNLDTFYKKEIEKYIPFLVDKYSKQMNLFPSSIKYRKNKRTWGSCNYKNGLNFNILLMKFPIEIMEYVVIHELAHIKHKNHSKNFWDLVEVYCPDYKQREKLFKNSL